jgi:hypothetical protein
MSTKGHITIVLLSTQRVSILLQFRMDILDSMFTCIAFRKPTRCVAPLRILQSNGMPLSQSVACARRSTYFPSTEAPLLITHTIHPPRKPHISSRPHRLFAYDRTLANSVSPTPVLSCTFCFQFFSSSTPLSWHRIISLLYSSLS